MQPQVGEALNSRTYRDEKEELVIKGAALRQVWGAHQKFFRALCLAAKVPRVCALAREHLASGHSVVIGLQSTGALHEAKTQNPIYLISSWCRIPRSYACSLH